ncbi:MAG: protein BatD [Magnetococcales bacterium]|nr:protein BatD [Magnetococcales bacterium]
MVTQITNKRRWQSGWQNRLFWVGVALLFVACLPFPAQAVEITLKVDRSPVAVNESFQLFFEVEGEVDGSPDFSVLKENFDILHTKQSTNLQYINGARRQTVSWALTLMPKQAGLIDIPPLSFGRFQSKPAQIKVTQERPDSNINSDAGSDLFLEVETDRETPYVQAQVVLTIRFFRAINLSGANMTQPQFEGGEVVVERLGEGQRYKTEHNGRPYIVEEHRYAFFPQESGTLTLKPIQLTATIGGGNRVFGSLFNDPFGRQRSSVKRVVSKSLTLQVRPIPASFKGKRWLPAHELILSEKWSQEPPQFITDEPITRTLSIMADGIPAKQLPELPHESNKGLKQYTDRPEVTDQVEISGIVGVRRQKNALIPTTPGHHQLAPIEIPWWDVDEDVMKIARVPGFSFDVSPSTNPNPNRQPLPPPPQPLVTATPPLPAPAKSPTVPATIPPQSDPALLFWLSLFLATGWMVTALGWWWSHHARKHSQEPPTPYSQVNRPNIDEIGKQLRQSCRENRPNDTRRLLIQWAKTQWPEEASPGLDTIGSRGSSSLRQELRRLDQALFAPDGSNWQGEALWQRFEEMARQEGKSQQTKPVKAALQPLYEP